MPWKPFIMRLDAERHSGDIPEYSLCVQCGRCSAGCPVAFESEHGPRKIVRFLQWGWLKEACESPFLWLCASCQTCTARCPRGVDIAGIMLALRRMAQEKGWVMPGEKLSSYRAFIDMIKKKGKISELNLGLKVALCKLPAHPVDDAALAWKLLRRGRLK
jgi:heterodisulfide reductase subunit C